jgi:hypothetical protein
MEKEGAIAMTINRRTLLGRTALALTAAGAIVLPAATAATELSGSKLNWRGELPSGWIGGNAQQIERVMRSSTGNDKATQDLRKIMQLMLPEAKNLDLYFVHLDVTATSTNVGTWLKSNAIKLGIDLKDPAARAALWQAFVQKGNEELAGSGVQKLDAEKTTTTGGRPAYTAVIRTDVKAGGTYYQVYHLVDQGGGNWHLLTMQADTNKFKARTDEFEGLLKSVRYGG